jgi:uncharacterized protein (DUF2267 family)
MATQDEAVAATRATLSVLAKRLAGGEAGDLAAQLPEEVGRYLRQVEGPAERFELEEFFERVSSQEGTDLPVAVHHARAVVSVLRDAATEGEIEDVLAQLPDDYRPLFESGSEGEMDV